MKKWQMKFCKSFGGREWTQDFEVVLLEGNGKQAGDNVNEVTVCVSFMVNNSKHLIPYNLD